jgi:hypothetical protein
MNLLLRLLLLGALLAGCANSPPLDGPSCCEKPAPGSVSVHMGGSVMTGVSIAH